MPDLIPITAADLSLHRILRTGQLCLLTQDGVRLSTLRDVQMAMALKTSAITIAKVK